MGLFDLFKSKKKIDAQPKVVGVLSKSDDDLTHLTPEGNLPLGWYCKNKDFIDKINNEYSFFLNNWLESRNGEPKKHYETLKSFVLYLEAVERICKSKGECFEFWFYETLTSRDYTKQRKEELKELQDNFDVLEKQYRKKMKELSDLDERLLKALMENQGVLQSDFVKKFDPIIHNDVKEKLYYLSKEGKLQRTKSGRSYTLHYRG